MARTWRTLSLCRGFCSPVGVIRSCYLLWFAAKVPSEMSPQYLALAQRSSGRSPGASPLHLVREDAESSLCGIPRAVLGQAGVFDQGVCPACLEWFDKRRAVSGTFPAV